MIEKLLVELAGLQQFSADLAQRVWDNSSVAQDLDNNPLSEEAIHCCVDRLADQLINDFPHEHPVLVGLMDGAIPFASLLCTALNQRNYRYNYTTMTVSSYGDELVSGTLTLGSMPKVPLFNRTVIVIDDVCDSGKTFQAIEHCFVRNRVKQCKFMALVDKVQARPLGHEPDYAGFKMQPTAFIIGMGLDYLQHLRNETSIKVANPASLPNAAEKHQLARMKQLTEQITTYIKDEPLCSRELEHPSSQNGSHSFFVNVEVPLTNSHETRVQSSSSVFNC